MLPAQDGDCLLLEYGDPAAPRRILVDGGRAATYPDIARVLAAPGGDTRLDLLVVTHVDQDHILGVLGLFEERRRTPPVSDVWFNGYDHLGDSDLETFGPLDGERLTTALLEQRLPWNAAFAGRAVEIGRPFDWLHDGSKVTLLSPDRRSLEHLIPTWRQECAKNGLIPGRPPEEPPPLGFEAMGPIGDIEQLADSHFEPDDSKTNRTSIAFLFEYQGVRIMFTGDAEDGRLVESIRPLAAADGGRLRLDVLKLSHHGSAKNLSRDLLNLIDCRRYLISTNGKRHGHPDSIAMARLLSNGGDEKHLVFNYRDRAALWDVGAWRDRYRYSVVAPAPQQDGLVTISFEV